ncbi:SLBB domain-containing protein [Ekhidna sp.]|jgi:protein involved in polysaccharide export with SLBB domain|uniref:SLBB domain-containing protein n=1 Tax=Ekhidna sp. TaxID=2608089 RepID=UPI0032EFE6F9
MKKSQGAILLLFFCVLLFKSFETEAQDISSVDLQSIQVDALSDEQIRAFIQRAQSSGMSQTQLEALARQRGMSETEISKLRARIYQLEPEMADQVQGALDAKEGRLRQDPMGAFFLDVNDFKLEELLKQGDEEFSIFGSSMFEDMMDQEVTFSGSLNLPTPKDYLLGAGDELIIDIYGASEITYQNTISPDGQIIISGIGPINVAGITVDQARRRIKQKLASIYSGLEGRNPNTFAQITVGNIRTIKVSLAGHVERPGTYTLNSFSNVFNALYLAGGPTETGSYRKIRLIRDGKNVAVFDIYDYLFNPEEANNPILQDGDRIVIDPYVNRVSLTGAVKYPAMYELKDGETLINLFDYSGGFEGKAYSDKVVIQRSTGKEKALVTVSKNDFEASPLQNGDSINIGEIADRFKNRVTIEGAVMRPGAYELTEGMMLSDLLESVEGLREDAFTGRGNIFRRKEDLTLKNIAFDVKSILEGNQDILLVRDDQIIIQSIFDLRENQTIQVKGEVRAPGIYQYLDGMTVEDVITQSGGFKESANKSVVEVARQVNSNQGTLAQTAKIFTFEINENLSISDSASNFELQPFDVILIKRSSFYHSQRLVKIEGEVLYPGFYALETREDKISDLIVRAGGLTDFAYADGATILRRSEYFEDTTSMDVGEDLEADLFRSKRLKDLQKRDADDNVNQLGEKESIGINLEGSLDNPGSKYDLILKDGDVVSIPRRLQTVRVRGSILYPNTVRFEPGMSAKRAISQAGGFTDDARPRKTYVIYANGSAERTRSFLFFKDYPKLEPGAEVIVPQRVRERQPLNAQTLIGLTSSLATLVLVITQIQN